MGPYNTLRMYGRFAMGLPAFFRDTITLEEARTIVRRRLAEREENFLRMMERGVFDNPQSPYLPLMALAGCEMGDIRTMVRRRGLEDTLKALREAGVFFTFEEYKGREPVVRDGKVIPIKPGDFDNPYLSRAYHGEAGGTTGAGIRVSTDLDHLADHAPFLMLTWHAHGVLDAPKAIWRGILPDPSGINYILRTARFDRIPRKWFSLLSARDLKWSLRYPLATFATVAIGRGLGVPIPWPETVRLDQADVVVRWAAETIEEHGTCLILTQVSRALRICLVAREKGIDLSGATFVLGGEPPTPAKVRVIESVGAGYFPVYTFAEAGRIGMGCSRPADCNDLHLLKDTVAMIQVPRLVPGSDITVDAFNFTTLLPSTPKILLNVEIDDYGILEERSCGCPLEGYGYTEHLRQVRSFSKLTGEGVTLVGSEMVHILEEVLPARFGGGPQDYQLLEEEDEGGFTRLSLLVDPKVDLVDEEELVETVMDALGEGSSAADQARAIWSQAGTLRIRRMEPIWTSRGKLMPLHMIRRSEGPLS